ncbi:hypothetical protein Esti_003955 [Eimeria stiedai]|uniref:Immune-mapped protein 1 n=1 Tax=Eimeria stiedai TaxID=471275 RepID=A0A8K1P7V6_9EIME|nr:immune-mapped protein 1 [Eimeria stiedai]
MGALCSRSGVQVPVQPVASNVVSTARKASEAAQKAAGDACEVAERAQKRASEAIDRLKQSLQANESSALQKVDAATEQAVKALEAQPDKIMMLSQEDQELLEQAKKQIAEQHKAEGTAEAQQAVQNEIGASSPPEAQQIVQKGIEASNLPPSKDSASSSPISYLFYASEKDGGSLLQQWVQQPMAEEEIIQKHFIQLASFVPAAHKTVPKARLQQNGGVTVFIKEILYRWDIWGKAQRQGYYQGWVKYLKSADDMEAKVTLKEFASPAPPATVFILHTSPTENKVIEVKAGEALPISLFGFVAAVPSSSLYKPGSNISSKRFGDTATEAGGAYLQLSRRGGDAAFDQEEVLKWLEADGLKVAEGGKGITLSEVGNTYERRSEQKGGNPSQQEKQDD